MRLKYCTNCGEDTRLLRWCFDCWRMVLKTLLTQLAAGLAAWLLHRWL